VDYFFETKKIKKELQKLQKLKKTNS